MTRKAGKGQERLWGENTVSIGRAPEAEPEVPRPIRATGALVPRRSPRRTLAGCMVILIAIAVTILALGGEDHRSAPASTPAPSAIKVAAPRPMPHRRVGRVPVAPRSAHRRHPHPRQHKHYREPRVAPTPEVEAQPPPAVVEVEPEASAPSSPAPEPVSAPQPTSSSTEFGIEGR